MHTGSYLHKRADGRGGRRCTLIMLRDVELLPRIARVLACKWRVNATSRRSKARQRCITRGEHS
jgi:hypothetical protein